MPDFLVEFGSEELPARFVDSAARDLEALIVSGCASAGLTHGAVRRFGTPRRLAVLVADVAARTRDVAKVVQGPSVRGAFEADGATPRIAAVKFAQSVGLSVETLQRVATPKGEYLAAQVIQTGRAAPDILAELIATSAKKLTFPKSMRWGDVEVTWGRPLQWILALWDDQVVPAVVGDVRSGRTSSGHRFLAPGPKEISTPRAYEATLRAAHVVPDAEQRKALLARLLEDVARDAGAQLVADPALLEQVTNLVEFPVPLLGHFEASNLELPVEVLMQEMRTHQRYFALADSAGNLTNAFIAVSNTEVDDAGKSVAGYERVLRARLADARFFYDLDKSISLDDRAARLTRRTYVAHLGSVADKVARIRSLALGLAELAHVPVARERLSRAADLCKADLETSMVGEFPELEGVMGHKLALLANEPPEVALAIREHYLPRHAGDALPTADLGALLGVADRLDSLVGLFALGKKPTGAKDEAGLRRACVGLIAIVIHSGYRFSLSRAFEAAYTAYQPWFGALKFAPAQPALTAQLVDFVRGRLAASFSDRHRPDVVEAVLAEGFDDLTGFAKRVDALGAHVGRPGFAQLASAFKRARNIVEKQGKDIGQGDVNPALLKDAAERQLWGQVSSRRQRIDAARRSDDWEAALTAVTELKPDVDAFFDDTLVMADDEALKINRIRLLREVAGLLRGIADIGLVQSRAGGNAEE